MPKSKFQPIFDYIDESQNNLKEEILAEVRVELRPLKTVLDNFIKEMKDWRDENKIANYRMTRAEGWIGKAAIKIDIPFET